ncbi:hypothetical protein ACSBR1_002000 [Camellia fascicularis]
MALKNDNDTWCTNQIELQARAVQHFQKLFITEFVDLVPTLPQSLPCLTPQEHLSMEGGIPIALNLGKYLGVPILHNRVSKTTYNHILDRVWDRLARWKACQLSLAERATLIQSVTSSIPSYAMQSTHLPSSVCSTIDKYHRHFLWGGDQTQQRMSLVPWEDACQPKEDGGLGLRQMRDVNNALLAKLGWRLALTLLCWPTPHLTYLASTSFPLPTHVVANLLLRFPLSPTTIITSFHHLSLPPDHNCKTPSFFQIPIMKILNNQIRKPLIESLTKWSYREIWLRGEKEGYEWVAKGKGWRMWVEKGLGVASNSKGKVECGWK